MNRSLAAALGQPYSSIATMGRPHLPRALEREVRRDAAMGEARGLVAVGYIRGTLYAAEAAQLAQTSLGMRELYIAQYMPNAAARVSAIADAATIVMANFINQLSQ